MSECIRRPHSRWTTCRCDDCRREQLRTRKLARTGHLSRVPSSQAWAVIEDRLALGWTAAAIASAAGLHDRTIQSALSGRTVHGRVQAFGPTVAARIVGMGAPTRGQVGTLGSTRRLRALARIGWALAPIAERAGVSTMTLSYLRAGRHESVLAVVAASIAAAYDELHMTVGTSTQSRNIATAQGWAPPLAFDDIDDPTETPHGLRSESRDTEPDDIAMERRAAGDKRAKVTAGQAVEIVRHLRASGVTDKDIERRTGLNPSRYAGNRERRAS